MSKLGIAVAEMDDHEHASVAFAQSTIHPNGAVIAESRRIAYGAVARGDGSIIPRDPAAWAAEVMRPFYWRQFLAGGARFDWANYWADLSGAVRIAQEVWGPLIESYGPLPVRPTDQEFASAMQELREIERGEPTSRRSYREGLRRPWWAR
jgi:hypothetical protein